ncbi:uncharacterized protein (DUF1697 family) [Flavobacterium endophyticum]|uniref:Uncharacterized protein (DUF1697 family) n=1 Tax=Flavobacterium endophyticum TaxID=1540163 RepID=A0A495MGL9_9FLAO|nr:DUF1697 domain-containing protein [Flavobacterium endophyticum]RKS25131.1 uncharacterized protein (DUF1697 family) [Flavobacterium endophyticum]
MKSHLALLRGINVSGQKLIKMETLRKAMEDNGYQNVKTYIQSGNILFDSLENSPEAVENQIHDLIEKHFGFDVSVVVINQETLESVSKNNPYLKEKEIDLKKLYITFLGSKPAEENIELLKKANFEPDEIVIKDRVVFMKYNNPAGNSKLTNKLIESKLKVKATDRNWNTTLKLLQLFQERDSA